MCSRDHIPNLLLSASESPLVFRTYSGTHSMRRHFETLRFDAKNTHLERAKSRLSFRVLKK